ncbi:MAG: 1,2-phenylacetyl-CoA epoxidase, subunit E [Formosa sp. Hel3_A1_48]|nr:MAG: 1,2-phenylacetyl-CoA epoxidase, subunit E [Formosa sp. Hel3_A1_48]
MASFYPLSIKSIHRETSLAVSISFQVPEDLKNLFHFEAGQYLTLKTKIDDEELRRDYSISSSPSSGDLTVTIKEIENGLFSSFANRALKVGDVLDVAPPKGRFTFVPNTDDQGSIVGFAAGSGITPIMSILKTVLESNQTQKFVLVYGNKSPKDTIFFQSLSELKAQYPNRFKLQYVYSQSQDDDALFGRIDRGNTNYVLKNLIPSEASSTFYLCGPEGMIQTVKDVLLENRVTENKILFELFTVSTQTNEEKNIHSTSHVETTLLVDDETTVFTMNPDQTILEAALKQDLDVPYSCQGGVCSSCICRITEGTAEMRQNSVLTDSEVAEGLVLSCQAVPTSSKIHVDFDDI